MPAHHQWTDFEDLQLSSLVAEGIDYRDIAPLMGRSKNACRLRASYLGLKKDRAAVLANRRAGREKFLSDPERVRQWVDKIKRQFTPFDRAIRAEELRQRNAAGITGLKGKHHTPEAKARISAANSHPKSAETRLAMSKGAKRRWAKWRLERGLKPRRVTFLSLRVPRVPYAGPGRVSMTFPQSLRRECTIDGRAVRLSPRLARILEILLLRGPVAITSYDELIEMIWPNPDDEPETGDRVLKVQVSMLRKLGVAIETEWGFGIRIAPEKREPCQGRRAA